MNRESLTFFTREGCHLCRPAWFVVRKVAQELAISVIRVDLDHPEAGAWRTRYTDDIPVLHLNGQEIFRHRVDEQALRSVIAAARERNQP